MMRAVCTERLHKSDFKQLLFCIQVLASCSVSLLDDDTLLGFIALLNDKIDISHTSLSGRYVMFEQVTNNHSPLIWLFVQTGTV
jgi:hypothetical protein